VAEHRILQAALVVRGRKRKKGLLTARELKD
jgi:hypothetical protein